jgi:hypothetical protein
MTFDILKSAASSAAIVSVGAALGFRLKWKVSKQSLSPLNPSSISNHPERNINGCPWDHAGLNLRTNRRGSGSGNTSAVVAWTFVPQNAYDVLYLPFD